MLYAKTVGAGKEHELVKMPNYVSYLGDCHSVLFFYANGSSRCRQCHGPPTTAQRFRGWETSHAAPIVH